MSDKTINETFVKLSSKVPFVQSIELGQDFDVLIGNERYLFNVVKSEDNDNQDGTVNRTYTLKSLIE